MLIAVVRRLTTMLFLSNVVRRRTGSKPKRLLVLGAGPAQLGLLEAARARGLMVIAADRSPLAPGSGSPTSGR